MASSHLDPTIRSLNPAKASVLVVDDSHLDGQLSMKAMEKYGIRARKHVGSAEDALKELRKKPFDLVLVDYFLPRMNGLELVAEIRAGWPETRIILVTGANDDHVAAMAIKAGASDYVSKDDFLTSGLINAVQSTLRLQQQEDAAQIAQTLANNGSTGAEAKAQIKWLKEGTVPAFVASTPVLNLNDPSVANAVEICQAYLSRLDELFPMLPHREEDTVMQMLLERGSSTQEVFLLFDRAFSRVELAANSGYPREVSFSPGLALARILGRLLEAYQQAWSHQAAEADTRRLVS